MEMDEKKGGTKQGTVHKMIMKQQNEAVIQKGGVL